MFNAICRECAKRGEVFPYPQIAAQVTLGRDWQVWRHVIENGTPGAKWKEFNHIFCSEQCEKRFRSLRPDEHEREKDCFEVKCDMPHCKSVQPVKFGGFADPYVEYPDPWIEDHDYEKMRKSDSKKIADLADFHKVFCSTKCHQKYVRMKHT